MLLAKNAAGVTRVLVSAPVATDTNVQKIPHTPYRYTLRVPPNVLIRARLKPRLRRRVVLATHLGLKAWDIRARRSRRSVAREDAAGGSIAAKGGD